MVSRNQPSRKALLGAVAAQGIVGRQAGPLGLQGGWGVGGLGVGGTVGRGRFWSCAAYEVWYRYPGLRGMVPTAPALEMAVLGHLLLQHSTQVAILLLCATSLPE